MLECVLGERGQSGNHFTRFQCCLLVPICRHVPTYAGLRVFFFFFFLLVKGRSHVVGFELDQHSA